MAFINHALVNPPIDRHKAADEVKDVFINIQKETDAGIYVSGAKVVATSSALTHYNFLGQNLSAEINDDSMAVMFMAPMDTPGVKLICRASYELAAAATGTPFDYPLTSRFDENDAIFIFDNAFIPWENVFCHRDKEMLKTFYPHSGFLNGFTFQGCTRLAVKLDFIIGLVQKALRVSGTDDFRGVQVLSRGNDWLAQSVLGIDRCDGGRAGSLGRRRGAAKYECIGDLSHSCQRSLPGRPRHHREDRRVRPRYIFLPVALDFKNPQLDQYLKRFVRGSNGVDYKERIKIMKMLWDAIGSEFGARHELYERNYFGNHEMIRIQALMHAKGSGKLAAMENFAAAAMADYDENGWLDPSYHNNDDVSIFHQKLKATE